jgi:hypothetical protein
MMMANGTVNMDIFRNVAGGNGMAVNDFDSFWVFKFVAPEIMLVSKFFVRERKSWASTINKGMCINFNIVVGKCVWYN